MLWQPDIAVEIELFPAAENGREQAISSSEVQYFGCPIEFWGEMYDVRFDLSEVTQEIAPGAHATLNAKFLYPELIKARLKKGDEFRLWEGKFIGKGKVLSVYGSLNSSLNPDSQH